MTLGKYGMLLAIFLSASPAFAQEEEATFKEILSNIAKISQAQYSSEEERWSYLRQERSKLKETIIAFPNSALADDAQYIVTVLTIPEPEQRVAELEQFLKLFPNAQTETWSRENLDVYFPNQPLELAVRTDLAVDYLKMGQVDRLEVLCRESAEKYPLKKVLFEKLLEHAQKR